VIKRFWTDPEPFDFEGAHVRVTGAFGSPKPVQQPHPPMLLAGGAHRTLRVVAEHADIWNIAGVGLDDAKTRSAVLDQRCVDIGRDPGTIARSTNIPVDYDDPAASQAVAAAAIDAGFTHLVLSLSAPYPEGVARLVADEIILPLRP
jgi:alkanesulfonate monooxygenase SsuD/methylene tetrahydromethanopterin reductase-like flavin-dependent oxidoreductase (luciferase family)